MSLPDIQQTEQFWIGLEIARLIISLLAIIVIIYLVSRTTRIVVELNKKQKTNSRIIKKRIDIYDRVVTRIYDLFCFYCYVGNWTEITPLDIQRLKRELDKDMNVYATLISGELIKEYNDFMQLCFISSTGWEHDVKIKALYEMRQEHNKEWKDDWIRQFDQKNVTDAVKMKERYNELIISFKKELLQV
ncbi:MAG: hypothetical protein ABFS28_11225 [Bacteroidota bacterium]